VYAFLTPISENPVHIYQSALPFCPRGTKFWEAYGESVSPDIYITPSFEQTWSACLSTLHGHTKPVTCLVLSPDSTQMASSSKDATIRIWDIASGTTISVLSGHEAEITTLVYMSDGLRLASGSADGSILLWNIGSGSVSAKLLSHSKGITKLLYTPFPSRLLSGSHDATVRLWDINSCTEIAKIEEHDESFNTGFIFSPNGQEFASSSIAAGLRVWDSFSGALVKSFDNGSPGIPLIAYSPDGKLLAYASGENQVQMCPVDSSTPPTSLYCSHPTGVNFSPDGRHLVCVSYDTGLTMYDTLSANDVARASGRGFDMRQVQFSPDGSRLFVFGDSDMAVRIYSVPSIEFIGILRGHTDVVKAGSLHPDCCRFFSGSYDGSLKIWDLSSSTLADTLKAHDPSFVSLHATITGRKEHTKAVTEVIVSPTGLQFVTKSEDLEAKIWTLGGMYELVALIGGYIGRDTIIGFYPSGEYLMSWGQGPSIEFWSTASGGLVSMVGGGGSTIKVVTVSPASGIIVSGDSRGDLKLWDPSAVAILQGHTSVITAAHFSPDGTRLASASVDESVRLWDVDTATSLSVIPGNVTISRMIFSPDGAQLALRSSARPRWAQHYPTSLGHHHRGVH
jgi:WD40 repeat protein